MILSNNHLNFYLITLKDCFDTEHTLVLNSQDLVFSSLFPEFVFFRSLQEILKEIYTKYPSLILSPRFSLRFYITDPFYISLLKINLHPRRFDSLEVVDISGKTLEDIKKKSIVKVIPTLYMHRLLHQLVETPDNEEAIKTFIHQL